MYSLKLKKKLFELANKLALALYSEQLHLYIFSTDKLY